MIGPASSRMKISFAAAKHCRVIFWFIGVAFAPLFGQTADHGNTAAAATLVNAKTTASGTLSPGGDVDYFRFVLANAARVTVYTTGAIDTTGSLRNSLDAEITSNDDGGTYPNFRIERDL